MQPANVSTNLPNNAPATNPSDRTKRVKDAKAEAQKEIDEYRQKKEEEYKKFESEVCHIPATTTFLSHTSTANQW